MGTLLAQPVDIFHRFAFLFEGVGKLLGGDGDRAMHELRDVVTLQQLTMPVGIGTGQFEGLAATAVAVDMGDERTGVVAVVAAAAEHHPFAVARPGVITLGVGRVEFAHDACFARLQVEHP